VGRYSVADAKNSLSALIDKALEGEEVIITRHGAPVVRIAPAQSVREKGAPFDYDKLIAERIKPKTPIDSVELLRSLYEDSEE